MRVFFFKQKTAYEVRISDWCSDVCPSDLDAAIVGNVIAEIGHRGGINRGNPDRIDAESDQIIQPLLNAFQIADAIPVHILKGTGIDLIDDPAFPPGNRHANKAFGRYVIRQARSASPLAMI